MKICSGCKQELPIDKFYRDRTKKDGRHNQCSDCYKKYYHKWKKRPEAKEAWRRATDKYYHESGGAEKKSKRVSIRTEIIRNIKNSNPCTDCSRYYPHYCMEFDHLPQYEKSFGISSGQSVEAILEEIKKCHLVCANCHAERTWRREHEVDEQDAPWYNG